MTAVEYATTIGIKNNVKIIHGCVWRVWGIKMDKQKKNGGMPCGNNISMLSSDGWGS